MCEFASSMVFEPCTRPAHICAVNSTVSIRLFTSEKFNESVIICVFANILSACVNENTYTIWLYSQPHCWYFDMLLKHINLKHLVHEYWLQSSIWDTCASLRSNDFELCDLHLNMTCGHVVGIDFYLVTTGPTRTDMHYTSTDEIRRQLPKGTRIRGKPVSILNCVKNRIAG